MNDKVLKFPAADAPRLDYEVLRGGWTTPADPMPMLLSIAEQHKYPLGTLVGAFLAMTEFVEKP